MRDGPGCETKKAMLATWIETAAKGRLGGPVRAGMWSTAVIGTHPVQDNQRSGWNLAADDLSSGLLPAYWIENKGGNSLWHAPIPLRGSAFGSIIARSSNPPRRLFRPEPYQDTIVRPTCRTGRRRRTPWWSPRPWSATA